MVTEITKNEYFLASFPKSGNTWVRFLIANMYNGLKKAFNEIDFHNIHDIIPELGNNISPYYKEFPQVYKTHSKFQDELSNVILIIRNPWDTMYSYYHYLNGERQIEITLNEVIQNPVYGISALVEHTQSYTLGCRNLLVVQYENILQNTRFEINRIFNFFHLNVAEDLMIEAIENSTFRKLRNIEMEKGRKYGNPEFMFTRSGHQGEGLQSISKNTKMHNYIIEHCRNSSLLESLYLS